MINIMLKCFACFACVLVFAVVGTYADLTQCRVKLEPIGCYGDDVFDRALQTQIINERDITSPVYNGRLINWKNFNTYLPGFICRCAEIALNSGYKVIGIQAYAECWGMINGEQSFNKHGKSDKCVDGQYKDYMGDNTNCVAATGMQETNFIYRIAPTECEGIYYEPVGCFKDDLLNPRPLPKSILNERDYSSENWNGNLVDWKNWNTYSPEMICRCAKKALGYSNDMFSIQFWAECWSGNEAENRYNRAGSSTKCRGKDFQSCSCNSYHCVGMARTNYVYRLSSTPKQPSSTKTTSTTTSPPLPIDTFEVN